MRISPRLKLEGAEDNLRKRVHRQASAELGVPPYLAFRTKDPAQSGSGIHQIIQNIAAAKAGVVEEKMVDKNIARDKGSLYRYGDEYEHYGESRARFYLQRIEDDIRKRFIPPFLSCERPQAPAA